MDKVAISRVLDPPPTYSPVESSLELERERTKQIEIQEKTKQMEIEYKMMELKLKYSIQT
jgi:hypothetical protein